MHRKNVYSKDIYLEVLSIWNNFKHDIKHSNRFFVGHDIVNLLDEIDIPIKISDSTKNIMSGYTIENTTFYRARIGNYLKEDDKEMLSPPIVKAIPGRCNPVGIPYLYITNNLETAISEVKPIKGDIITIIEINIKKDKIFSFNILKYFDMINSSEKVIKSPKLGALIDIINEDLSSIIKSNKEIDYLPFQFLAEYIKMKGYNGFSYRSVMSDTGENFVFFSNTGINIVSKNIYKIDSVKYNYTKL